MDFILNISHRLHQLNEEQRRGRVEWCLHMLGKCDGGRSDWVWDIVTGDDTFVYQYDPETKQQSSVIEKHFQTDDRGLRSFSPSPVMWPLSHSRRGRQSTLSGTSTPASLWFHHRILSHSWKPMNLS